MGHAEIVVLRRKARVLDKNPLATAYHWFGRGWRDLQAQRTVSLSYKFGFLFLGWVAVLALARTGFPLLGNATWHTNADPIEQVPEASSVSART